MAERSMDVGDIIAYETGDLDDEGILRLFSDGIASGQVWNLQGAYGRMAASMIEAGLIDREGNIDWAVYDQAVAE